MARPVATNKTVERDELLDFVRERHHWVVSTLRSDGRPQMSPVSGGVNGDGHLVVSTYPSRDKVHNIRRNPAVSVCVQSDHFGGAWVQVDGQARIVDLPEAMEGLVDYYRSISGEHPDWDEYRAAMERQGKCLIVIEIERWGPVATGGFPAPVVKLLDQLDAELDPELDASADTPTDSADAAGSGAEDERPMGIAGFDS